MGSVFPQFGRDFSKPYSLRCLVFHWISQLFLFPLLTEIRVIGFVAQNVWVFERLPDLWRLLIQEVTDVFLLCGSFDIGVKPRLFNPTNLLRWNDLSAAFSLWKRRPCACRCYQ